MQSAWQIAMRMLSRAVERKGDIMSKKHFIALAESIIEANRISANTFTEEAISTLADFCRAQNPNFNRSRWLGYIAGTNGKNGGAR
jgi:hypothetical protein